jgi:hypothetical protein
LAIGKSHGDRPAGSRRAASAGRADTGPIFGGWDGLKAAGAASEALADGERSMNAAEPDELNLDLRLEHELQTAMIRQRRARPRFR